MMKIWIYTILGTLGIASAAILGPADRIYLKPQTLPSTGVTGQIMVDGDDSNTPKVWQGTAWGSMGGGGSGFGRTNLLSGNNIDFETGNGDWYTTDDGAVTEPAFASGTANITVANNTSTPLRGGASYRITLPSATDLQGEGVAVAVTAETADKGLVTEISFDYLCDSDYTDDDLEIWVYDSTNTTAIQPVPYLLKANQGNPSRFKAYFQTASDSTAYIVGFFRSVTATLSAQVDCDIDTVFIGPPSYNFGTPDVYLGTKTTTHGLTGGSSTTVGHYWRKGDMLIGKVRIDWPTIFTGGTAYIVLPTEFSIDYSKLPSASYNRVGNGVAVPAGGNYAPIDVLTNNASTSQLLLRTYVDDSGTTSGFSLYGALNTTQPDTWVNNDWLEVSFQVPISGWGTNIALSADEGDQRAIYAQASRGTTQTLTDSTITTIVFSTEVYDSHSAYNTSTGEFTAPASGVYKVSSLVTGANAAGGWDEGDYLNMYVYVDAVATRVISRIEADASPTSQTYQGLEGSTFLKLNAGQVVTVRVENKTGVDWVVTNSGLFNHINITKVQSPAAIAPNESIVASYYVSTSTSNSSFNTLEIVDYDTKVYDTHGAVTTGASWKFTAPASGHYRVSTKLAVDSITPSSLNQGLFLDLYLNGVANTRIAVVRFQQSGTGMAFVTAGSTIIQLDAGDYIDIRVQSTTAGTHNITRTTPRKTFIDINRIGF